MKFRLTFLLMFFSTLVNAQNISGKWLGLLDTGVGKMHIVFDIKKDAKGKDVCFMDSPDQCVKGIRSTLSYLSADSISLQIPALNIFYNGKLVGEQIKGIFSQYGMKFNLVLEQKALSYKRPQNPKTPYPYTTEEVCFTNKKDNVTLSGTLTFPIGYTDKEQVPVLIMVTGSGGQNRDEEVFNHKPFLVIADYLARKGIATLRYDDRGIAKSKARCQALTTKVVADDAEAGVLFLKGLHRFSKVGILGHSEGANVAFMLGAKDLLDFAVAMAGVGVKGDEALYQQTKKIVELSGKPYPMTKEQFKSRIFAQNNPWLNYFMDYDPTKDIQHITCPVFVLNGAKDLQVLPSLNMNAIEQNLPKHKQSKVRIYPNLNHLFQNCSTGSPSEYSSIEETIAPVVLEDIANWLNSL